MSRCHRQHPADRACRRPRGLARDRSPRVPARRGCPVSSPAFDEPDLHVVRVAGHPRVAQTALRSQLGPEPHHIADIGEPALAQTAGHYGTQLADPGLRWAVPCRFRDQVDLAAIPLGGDDTDIEPTTGQRASQDPAATQSSAAISALLATRRRSRCGPSALTSNSSDPRFSPRRSRPGPDGRARRRPSTAAQPVPPTTAMCTPSAHNASTRRRTALSDARRSGTTAMPQSRTTAAKVRSITAFCQPRVCPAAQAAETQHMIGQHCSPGSSAARVQGPPWLRLMRHEHLNWRNPRQSTVLVARSLAAQGKGESPARSDARTGPPSAAKCGLSPSRCGVSQMTDARCRKAI